jgi:hypothetical protein
MKRFEAGTPAPGCMFPKPRRVKRSASAWRRAKVSVDENGNSIVIPAHNDLVDACIEIAEREYGFATFHIPDSLYRLISIPREGDALTSALERALGEQRARGIKAEIADAMKGKPDIVVFVPLGGRSEGFSVSLSTDAKTGAGRLNAAQRRWQKEASMSVTRSVDGFRGQLEELKKLVVQPKHFCSEGE